MMQKQYPLFFALFSLLLLPLSLLAQEVDVPQGMRIKAYQHEIELMWNAAPQTQWEVAIDDLPPVIVSHPKYTFAGLEHRKTYTLKVRALRQGKTSAYSSMSATTHDLDKKADDPTRIPYLRTVRIDGMAPQRLPLYFNDLANIKAKITYKLNGEVQQPVDHHLLLPSAAYRAKLEIAIDEGGGNQWNITYLLFLEK